MLLAGAFALVAGCESPANADPGVSALEVNASPAIVTVATVTWTTETAVRMSVVYGDGGRSLATPLESSPSREHSAVLIGLSEGKPVTFDVVDEAGTAWESGEWTTGWLPSELPTITAAGSGQDQFMATPLLGETTAATVLDPDGRIVWYHVDDRGLDVYRVRPSHDGTGVWYNAASVSGDPSEDSELVKVSWDGTIVESTPVPLLAHDFVEMEDGTLVAIAVEYGEDAEGNTLRGDKLVQVEPGGLPETIWTTWDCFDPAVVPGDEPSLGWTFVNALDYDPATDHFMVSVRNFSSLVWIDRASGVCDRAFGGSVSDYQMSGARFLHEHQFEVSGDDVIVFDNMGAGGNRSRAIEYTLDDTAKTATEVWNFLPTPDIYNFVLGDVARLDNGDTFVAFSVGGVLDRVSPEGDVSWSAVSEIGTAFGFVTLSETLP